MVNWYSFEDLSRSLRISLDIQVLILTRTGELRQSTKNFPREGEKSPSLIFRNNRPFGNQLHARKISNQKMEMMIVCGVLNRFTSLGMPQSYRYT
ncbi:hypothetical protein BOO25_08995 [Vibrio navarrensis]|nr:hypothetical protein [Vibrio navarrensis]